MVLRYLHVTYTGIAEVLELHEAVYGSHVNVVSKLTPKQASCCIRFLTVDLIFGSPLSRDESMLGEKGRLAERRFGRVRNSLQRQF